MHTLLCSCLASSLADWNAGCQWRSCCDVAGSLRCSLSAPQGRRRSRIRKECLKCHQDSTWQRCFALNITSSNCSTDAPQDAAWHRGGRRNLRRHRRPGAAAAHGARLGVCDTAPELRTAVMLVHAASAHSAQRPGQRKPDRFPHCAACQQHAPGRLACPRPHTLNPATPRSCRRPT